MSIRRDPIYISNEVWKALWLLAKADALKTGRPPPDAFQIKDEYKSTPDEVADKLLRKAITQFYPEVFDHQKQIEKLEKETIESLRTHENPRQNV